jgi:hypothetical protein
MADLCKKVKKERRRVFNLCNGLVCSGLINVILLVRIPAMLYYMLKK